MAIRGGYVSFYYKGGSLFACKTNKCAFETHYKYAFVPDLQGKKTTYIREAKLADMEKHKEFHEAYAYAQIKERCALYAGLEAAGVSELHKFSYAVESRGDYFLLDTEIALDASIDDEKADAAMALSERKKEQEVDANSSPQQEQDELSASPAKGNSTDRIDLLLMDATGRLLFCEAKHFSNAELTATKGQNIVEQLGRYRGQIERKGHIIIEEYRKYVTAVNVLFGLNLPEPKSLCDDCGLLVFGFDADQEDGKKLRGIKERVTAEGFPLYPIGDIKGIKSSKTLFTELAN